MHMECEHDHDDLGISPRGIYDFSVLFFKRWCWEAQRRSGTCNFCMSRFFFFEVGIFYPCPRMKRKYDLVKQFSYIRILEVVACALQTTVTM